MGKRKIKTERRPEILDAALAIAAERGLDAVSMRTVAERVGVTPMALYGYFEGKDALLDALVGLLLSDLPAPDPSAPWEERLELIANGARDTARRHPAVFPLLFSRPSVTPAAVLVVDLLYQALLDAGVPEAHVPRVERLVSTFVLGFAVSEAGGRFSAGSADARSRRGGPEPGHLPAHHRLAAHLDAAVDWDAEFRADLEDLMWTIKAAAARGTG
ncbi:TetR/AcrR family transcriptional regulator [Sphaerisporangium corydalis]|uniref:TetR/AcrR family transcriptional regulator n=1 Tax=Sphaerisporangium corydalis TaxID=1441875 RepID=A0ABV9E8N0_9ACTN|nr:TetR/AcrR family transcriptional regulator [Sphaerisporangium corydalis]